MARVLYNRLDPTPTRKVVGATLAGAVAAILVFVGSQVGIDLEPIEAPLIVVFTAIGGYFTRDRIA